MNTCVQFKREFDLRIRLSSCLYVQWMNRHGYQLGLPAACRDRPRVCPIPIPIRFAYRITCPILNRRESGQTRGLSLHAAGRPSWHQCLAFILPSRIKPILKPNSHSNKKSVPQKLRHALIREDMKCFKCCLILLISPPDRS